MVTVEERIAAWLDAVLGAISGQGGHNQTFRVACRLYNGWGLSEADTLRWLQRYNEKCEPAWTLAELKHKVTSATKAEHSKPRGHMARDEGYRTKSVPILRPNKDARPPVKGKLAGRTIDAEDAFLPTSSSIGKTTLARIYEKSQRSVLSVSNGSQASDPLKENSERSVLSVSEQFSPEQLAEADRIAKELVKLRDAGAIKGPNDPEARFYEKLIRVFEGEFIGKRRADGSIVEDTEPL